MSFLSFSAQQKCNIETGLSTFCNKSRKSQLIRQVHILIKNIVDCRKLQILYKNKARLGNNFHFQISDSKNLTSGVVYKFQCGNLSYYGEYDRHLNVRTAEHIGISLPPKNKLSLRTAP